MASFETIQSSSIRRVPAIAPNAVVVLANFFQFYRRQQLKFPCVHSRMLLWCKSGYGRLTINGVNYDLAPDDFMFLPWKHSISYHADASAPPLIGSIHMIPDHTRNKNVVLNVAHWASESLSESRWRKDCDLPGLNTVIKGRLHSRGSLGPLIEYVVELFYSRSAQEWQLRHLAQLLIAELMEVSKSGTQNLNAPLLLQQAFQYINEHIEEPICLNDLVRRCGYSAPTIRRIFRVNAKMSPMQWIIRAKMDYAARLLTTTALPIGEIGQRVGIEDPYYFSRLFKKTHATTASKWRRKSKAL